MADLRREAPSSNIIDSRTENAREREALEWLFDRLIDTPQVPTSYNKTDRKKGDREDVDAPLPVIRGMGKNISRGQGAAQLAMLAAVDPEAFIDVVNQAGASVPPPPTVGGPQMAAGGNGVDPRLWFQGPSVPGVGVPNPHAVPGLGTGDLSLNQRTLQPGGVRDYYAPGSASPLGSVFDQIVNMVSGGGGTPAPMTPPMDPYVGQPQPGVQPYGSAPGASAPPPPMPAPGAGMRGGVVPGQEMGPSNLPMRPGSPAAASPFDNVPMPQGVQVPTDAPGVNPDGSLFVPGQAPAQAPAMMPSGAPVPLPMPKPDMTPAPGWSQAPGTNAQINPVPIPQPKPTPPGTAGETAQPGYGDKVKNALAGVKAPPEQKMPPSAGVNGPRPTEAGNALMDILMKLGGRGGAVQMPSLYSGRR